MLIELKPILDTLHQHPHWASFAIFSVSFLESLAVIGLIFPGVVIMTAIGTLIGTGVLSFIPVIIWCVLGAVLGDVVSFWLGYHFHEHIRDFWPFRAHTNLLKKGEKFFLSHGGKSVLIGRFVGPMRPLLPLIAGMMSMPPLRFLIADVLSSVAWAPSYMLPGILLGIASQELAPEMATHLILITAGLLLALWCISWLIRFIYSTFKTAINHMLARLWYLIRSCTPLKRLEQMLTDPTHPESHHQLGLAIIFIINLLAFGILLINIKHQGIFVAWNEPFYYLMRSLRTTALDPIMVGITTFNTKVLTIMWSAVGLWLLLRRYFWAAGHWLGLGILVIGCGKAVKLFLHFPRPSGLIQIPAGWSFPSGHVLLSIAFFGFLAVLLTRNCSRTVRWAAYSCAMLLATCVLISRVYLGAHWLSDVIGSALLATSLVAATTLSYRRRSAPPVSALGVLFVAIGALFCSWLWYFKHDFQQDLLNYTPAWTIQIVNNKQWWAQNKESKLLYRTNHFGKPIDVINVQWADTLPHIKQSLSKQHWNLLPRTSLLLILKELTTKNYDQNLPLLSQFYEDNKPVLIMFKILPKSKAIIILRLWDAHIKLGNGQPLWLGTITYHKPWHMRFLKHAKEKKLPIHPPAASDILSADLMEYHWKKITYTPTPTWDGTVLLIR